MRGSYRKEQLRHLIGFIWAFVLTIAAYYITVSGATSDRLLAVVTILILAGLQTVAHAYFFLHLKDETRPRWKSYTFVYTIIMALIIIVGSLWVVYNMNYNMGMSGHEMDQKMLQQNKKGF